MHVNDIHLLHPMNLEVMPVEIGDCTVDWLRITYLAGRQPIIISRILSSPVGSRVDLTVPLPALPLLEPGVAS